MLMFMCRFNFCALFLLEKNKIFLQNSEQLVRFALQDGLGIPLATSSSMSLSFQSLKIYPADPIHFQALWYAVRTKPHQESLACQVLQRLDVEIFYPRLAVSKALFPSYLFAKFAVNTHLRRVRFAQGVKGVVSFGSKPAPVDESLLEAIRLRIKNGFVILEPPSFEKGERVIITAGPFAGVKGIFDSRVKDSDRVVILLNILSGQGRVVIQNRMISKAS